MAELLNLGLLRPDYSPADIKRVASRAAMTRVEEAVNPAAWRALVGNKGIFYRVCPMFGIPVPRMWGLIVADRLAWWHAEAVPDDPRDVSGWLQGQCPDEFVLKPSFGGYGQGVDLIRRESPDVFASASGERMSLAELRRRVCLTGGDNGCVVQERVVSHPELRRLSGSRHLQTARLMTMLDRDGQPHLLHAHLKIICRDNHIDNFVYGHTGNLVAPVSIGDGRLLSAAGADAQRGGLVDVSQHPETGVAIAGFQLPQWAAVVELARTLARQFAPLRFVGWDIAMTSAGPLVIEGNWNSDPPNSSHRTDRLLAEIRRLA